MRRKHNLNIQYLECVNLIVIVLWLDFVANIFQDYGLKLKKKLPVITIENSSKSYS